MTRHLRLACLVAALAGALLTAPRPAAACPGPGDPCTVETGDYLLLLPQGAAEGPVPAMMYLHGWAASPEGFLNGRAEMVETTLSRGYALIVPRGLPRRGRTQRDWAVRDGGQHPRDDVEFLAAVLRDAASRGVDRDRVLLAGFSRGGSMVWDLACRAPVMARAYAPIAGAFWEPLSARCAGPVDLFHIHGWGDTVVPLEGRPIGSRLMQGDVFAALSVMRRTMRCDLRQPDERRADESLRWQRTWTRCALPGRLDFVLHPGGHVVPDGWLDAALTWFEARLAEAPQAPAATPLKALAQ
ncbi:MAG: PHB depolymerase family esterase [Pseudomonadota bacterium]